MPQHKRGGGGGGGGGGGTARERGGSLVRGSDGMLPRRTEPWRLYRLVSSQETAMKKDREKGRSRKNSANIGGAAYAPQQDEPR